MMYWGDSGWGGWVVMTLMMVAFWAGVIVLVAAVLRGGRSEPEPRDQSQDARRLLDERFARGEIDEDDYNRRRELLSSL